MGTRDHVRTGSWQQGTSSRLLEGRQKNDINDGQDPRDCRGHLIIVREILYLERQPWIQTVQGDAGFRHLRHLPLRNIQRISESTRSYTLGWDFCTQGRYYSYLRTYELVLTVARQNGARIFDMSMVRYPGTSGIAPRTQEVTTNPSETATQPRIAAALCSDT